MRGEEEVKGREMSEATERGSSRSWLDRRRESYVDGLR